MTSTPLETGRRFIEHAPADPGQVNPDLAGWRGKGVDICAHCAGRIIARGCSLGLIATDPVWKPDQVFCEFCHVITPAM